MTIYDPYSDPNRVPTTVDTGRRGRSARDRADQHTPATRVMTQVGPATTEPTSDPYASHVGGQILDRNRQDEPDSPRATDERYPYDDRPPHRSPVLTALGSFVSLSITPLTVILMLLIWLNQQLCADGLSTIECPGTEDTGSGLLATAITGMAALVVSMIGGGRIKRTRNTAGVVLVTLAAGAMTLLIAWLRQNLGVPFPF
ncbi:hypothetical protein ACO0LV_14105 [Pseudactinotalea sp. Z1739]|uniref:hypothetical protein n=1 Tax=Pseudactinotalea sp. Z1739 TaxID=3413028 RepID=UPI003C7B882A